MNTYLRGIELIRQTVGENRVKLNQPIRDYSHLETEALADGLFVASSTLELIQILDLCWELKVPFFVLGSGSRSIISNKGFGGMVIKNSTSMLKIVGFKGKVGRNGIGLQEATVEVSSGVSLAKLNEFLKSQSLIQIESDSLDLSTVGAAIFQDQALKDRTEKIKIWENGLMEEIEVLELRKASQVVLSLLIKQTAQD